MRAEREQPGVTTTATAKFDRHAQHTQLYRKLSTRQVAMIAIAGTIGTGLFLGTGRALATGGPASILICYAIIGFVVYITLLLLGELATQYPVAGSFTVYSSRFFSPSYAFALSWNYWFNDAVSVASGLTALQLVLGYWTDWYPWVISLVFLAFLLSLNAVSVRAYGELEYVLSLLKVFTIIAFIITGILVNVGVNRDGEYIGGSNWRVGDAPFVSGAEGFARAFVTASYAYGGTESLAITAGETENPTRNMPRVVKTVFWRIIIFYILSILLIGLNVPYTYPNLSTRTATTSPFTIVFYEAGSTGNHALYAGTRLLHSYASSSPRIAPRIFARTTPNGVPIFALFATASISGLCFASSYVGSGELWGWLQNIVGVSNQIAWLSIGLASWRFRKAWVGQGRPLSEMKYRARWTWPWGGPFVVITVTIIILFQGWTSFSPEFSPIDFVSLYLEIGVMIVMTTAWFIVRHRRTLIERQFHAEAHLESPADDKEKGPIPSPVLEVSQNEKKRSFRVLVDIRTVDLYQEEHEDTEHDEADNQRRAKRRKGMWGWAWRIWDIVF